MRSLLLTVALTGLLHASCHDTTLEAGDYDQTCAVHADCMFILTGDICECVCNYGAINVRDATRYYEDASDARSHCGDDTALCGPCASPPAFCNAAGRCEVGEIN